MHWTAPSERSDKKRKKKKTGEKEKKNKWKWCKAWLRMREEMNAKLNNKIVLDVDLKSDV